MVVNAGTINSFSNSGFSSSASSSRSVETAAPLLASVNSRQSNLSLQAGAATANEVTLPQQIAERSSERSSESVRVSSSIGRAASAGQLTREQALEIYRNIARFL